MYQAEKLEEGCGNLSLIPLMHIIHKNFIFKDIALILDEILLGVLVFLECRDTMHLVVTEL